MRRPLLQQSLAALALALVAQPALAEDKPSSDLDLAMVNRLTWGATSAEVQRMRAMGAEAWLQAELHPPASERLPPAAQAMVDALPMRDQSTVALVREFREQLTAAKATQAAMPPPGQGAASNGPAAPNPMQVGPSGAAASQSTPPAPPTPQEVRRDFLGEAFKQDQTRLILRALYSPNQLREQLTAFWLNHFNVYTDKAEIRLFVRDYEDQAIRPHALGRFRDLLEATLRSPAMLQYLDNAQNAKGHINENYAREIMELHTMGVGSGYTQKDVQELARILTGVGIVNPDRPEQPNPANPGAIRDGMFAFYPGRHDMGDKVFLGHVIKGSGYDEVRQALDILCAQPATARHVSRQLAQYFVADSPPPALVDRMAARWAQSGGDIAAVLDLLFHSPEFRASLSRPLLKDPQHFVLSAVRMAYDDRVIANTQPVANWLNRLGQPFYGHLTPDGYPLERTAWNGPGQIEQRFEIAQAIGNGSAGLFKGEAPSSTPRQAFPVLQGALYYGGLDKQLSPGTRTALDQAASPQEWNVLFLASPDFMGR